MNIDTGEIISPDKFDMLDDVVKQMYVEVDKNDMTKKQLKEMKVSLSDRRSKMGKLLTGERRKRTLRTLRKKGKLK